MKYRITGAAINQPSDDIYSPAIDKRIRSTPRLSLNVTIDVLEYDYNELSSLSSIEHAIKGHYYEWLTEQKLHFALKKVFPEEFI